MEYEWSAEKSATNLAERGFDFAFGKADGITLTLVYTDRVAEDGRPVRRIISARRSNSDERKRYKGETHQ